MKRLITILLALTLVVGISVIVSAETVTVAGNQKTARSAAQYTTSGPGSTYYVQLTSVGFNGLPPNIFPSSGKFTMVLQRFQNNDYKSAGNIATFTSLSSASPSVFATYQSESGNYKILVKNYYSQTCTLGLTWNP